MGKKAAPKAAPKQGATSQKVSEKVRKSALKGASDPPKGMRVTFAAEKKKPQRPTGDEAIKKAIQKQKQQQVEPKTSKKTPPTGKTSPSTQAPKPKVEKPKPKTGKSGGSPPKTAPWESGFVTPPTKRVSKKSPDGAGSTTSSTRSTSTTRTAKELEAAREKAEKALREKHELQLAAKKAGDTAAMDAAGMTEFLEKMGEGTDPNLLLKKYQQQKKDLEDKKKSAEVDEESEDMEEEDEEGMEEEQDEEEGMEDEQDEEQDEEDEEGSEDPNKGCEDDAEEEQEDEEENAEEDEEEEEDEEMQQDDNLEDPLASAVATTRTQSEHKKVRNSTTHKLEWDRFARQCANKSVFPISLAGAYKRSKTDLFGAWLDAGMNWDQTQVLVQRRQDSKNLARRQMTGVQAKTLKEKLGEEKANRVINLRKDQGLYYPDDDFPDDPEDRGNLKQKNRGKRLG